MKSGNLNDWIRLHGFTAVAELKQLLDSVDTATDAASSGAGLRRLHGFTAVAELKQLLDSVDTAKCWHVSTASPPWPN